MNLFIYCNSNSKVGYGHFKRCLNLVKWVRKENTYTTIVFVGDFDDLSIEELTNSNIRFIDFSPDLINNLYEIYSVFSYADYVIIDSYDINQKFIDDLISLKHLKTIVIDDFNNLDLSKVSSVVNFTLNAKNILYSNKNSFLGTDFLIIKPELAELRAFKVKKAAQQASSILIFLSGTGAGNHLIDEIISIINSTLSNLDIYVISVENKTAKSLKVESNNIHLLPVCNEIERYLNLADLVICGGGLMKYESCYCNLPTAVISLNKGQYNDSKDLSDNGLCYDLGILEDFKVEDLKAKLISFLTDTSLQNKLTKNCTDHFKTESSKLLIKNIFRKNFTLMRDEHASAV